MHIHKDTYINVPCSALYNTNPGSYLARKCKHPLSIFFSVIKGAWGMPALFCFDLVFSIFFTLVVTKHWHSLPREAVESLSLEKVTSHLGNWLMIPLLEPPCSGRGAGRGKSENVSNNVASRASAVIVPLVLSTGKATP